MFITGYKFEIERLSKVLNLFPGLLPYDWNTKTQLLSVSAKRSRQLSYKVFLALSMTSVVSMWLRMLTKSYIDLFITILGLTIAAGNTAASWCRWNWKLSPKYIHSLNQFISLENHLERNGYFNSKSNLLLFVKEQTPACALCKHVEIFYSLGWSYYSISFRTVNGKICPFDSDNVPDVISSTTIAILASGHSIPLQSSFDGIVVTYL